MAFSQSKQLLEISQKSADFESILINRRHSHEKGCFHNCTLWAITITVDPWIKFDLRMEIACQKIVIFLFFFLRDH